MSPAAMPSALQPFLPWGCSREQSSTLRTLSLPINPHYLLGPPIRDIPCRDEATLGDHIHLQLHIEMCEPSTTPSDVRMLNLTWTYHVYKELFFVSAFLSSPHDVSILWHHLVSEI